MMFSLSVSSGVSGLKNKKNRKSVPKDSDVMQELEKLLSEEVSGLVSEQDEDAAAPSESPKKRGYVKYSPLSLIFLAVCAFVFSFSIVALLDHNLTEAVGDKGLSEISGIAFTVPDIGDASISRSPSDGGDVLSPSVDPVGSWQAISPDAIFPGSLPYLQNVNFSALLERNEDTVAWLYWPTSVPVQGLPFNMPVVQGKDNGYYLNHAFDRSYNENGWVFADCRVDMTDIASNRNTPFFGHARSYTIFGGLKYLNTKTQWAQDGYNHFIYINTPQDRTVWQVFSWYETTVDFDYIQTDFSSDEEYLAFLQTIQSKNEISAFRVRELTAQDRIITLSTCKGLDENVRVAVHAVLVKRESADSTPNQGTVPNPPSSDLDPADPGPSVPEPEPPTPEIPVSSDVLQSPDRTDPPAESLKPDEDPVVPQSPAEPDPVLPIDPEEGNEPVSSDVSSEPPVDPSVSDLPMSS